MCDTAAEQLLAGRAAVKRYAWREAYDLLQAIDVSGALSAEDLEGLADAALWITLIPKPSVMLV